MNQLVGVSSEQYVHWRDRETVIIEKLQRSSQFIHLITEYIYGKLENDEIN